ncbi:Protein of unknown function [Natronincola peptidivorans]|uniref:Metal-dependent enzyme n=1 Tax=Natronincola peptidivorans TaxID=426128 RepID=A0A1I0GB32_9FIRM|nr:DUF1385 domain-containing protein [Natronincola peptidivorans]SET67934.1 Protein of unknown function [Natronincola peptidivorans]
MKLGGYSHTNGITFFCDVIKIRAIKRKKAITYEIDWILPKGWLRKLEGRFFLGGLLVMYYQWKIMNIKHKVLMGTCLTLIVLDEIFHLPSLDSFFSLSISRYWLYAILAAGILLYKKRIVKVLQYHGAEHKVINCYLEFGYINHFLVKRSSRFNKKCGTNLAVITVVLYSVLWLLNIDSLLSLLVIFLLAIQAAKIIASKTTKWDKYINIFQWITVLEPKPEDIDLAIHAFNRLQQTYHLYCKEKANY